jgi:hypothetical protein
MSWWNVLRIFLKTSWKSKTVMLCLKNACLVFTNGTDVINKDIESHGFWTLSIIQNSK